MTHEIEILKIVVEEPAKIRALTFPLFRIITTWLDLIGPFNVIFKEAELIIDCEIDISARWLSQHANTLEEGRMADYEELVSNGYDLEP